MGKVERGVDEALVQLVERLGAELGRSEDERSVLVVGRHVAVPGLITAHTGQRRTWIDGQLDLLIGVVVKRREQRASKQQARQVELCDGAVWLKVVVGGGERHPVVRGKAQIAQRRAGHQAARLPVLM